MNTELEEIPDDADQPLTKGDLYALEQHTSRQFDAMKGDLYALEQHTSRQFDAMLELVKTSAKETRDHFEVIAENIHQDVAAANKDEITSLRDKIKNHEERLKALEPSY